jgi:hypothetical protein
MKWVIMIAVIVCCPFGGRAQCPYWPADCPGTDYTHLDPVQDSLDKLGNPLVPEEVAMEHRLRELTTTLVGRIAEKEHWEAVELNEGGASGYRDLPPNDTPLNYALRPPHWFGISFQVIVNKDSLEAWSSWLKDLSERRLAQVNKYSDLMVAGQDKYKAYINADSKIEEEKRSRGLSFRESSLLLVEFEFNIENANVEGGRATGIGGQAGSSPGFTMLRWYSYPEPDMQDAVHSYTHSRNVVLALNGGWNLRPDANGFYLPAFRVDRKNTDHTTIKNSKCDQVQASALYLSGNKPAMGKFLADLPVGELNAVIAGVR